MTKPRTSLWNLAPIALIIASFAGGLYVRNQFGPSPPTPGVATTDRRYASLDVAPTVSPLDLFYEVFRHVRTHYVDPIQDQTPLSHGVLRGMAAYFPDPVTRFVTPEEAARMDREAAGQFEGIGAVIEVKRTQEPVTDPAQRAELAKLIKEFRDQGETSSNIGFTEDTITKTYVTIVAPVPGGPADRAGLLAGDRVDYINDQWVVSYMATLDLLQKRSALRNQRIQRKEYDAAVDALEARLKTALTTEKAVDLLSTGKEPLRLRVQRPGGAETISVTVTPGAVKAAPVAWEELGAGLGYVRISAFSTDAPAQLRSALNALKSKQVKQIVLDLRNCALGSRAEMLQMAGMLLGSATVARLQNKQGSEERTPVRTPSGEPVWSGPIAVVTNRGTAGLAEVMAAALREKEKATIVGARTAGDTMARDRIRLEDGASLVIPTGKYFTAGGLDFSGVGLEPDSEVPEAAKIGPASTDPAVRKAIEILRMGVRR